MRKLTRKCATFQVLVLEERLLDRPDELFRGFPLELMDSRYGSCSTVFCTQFRQKGWRTRFADVRGWSAPPAGCSDVVIAWLKYVAESVWGDRGATWT